MGPIDSSVANVAMPTLSRVFHVDLNTVGWVSMSYLLVLGSLILTYGRLGDMFCSSESSCSGWSSSRSPRASWRKEAC
ncbi:MAG: hypothetical protein ACYC9Q_08370 [Bacillota bacterium]